MTTEATPREVGSHAGLGLAPEGCTPADAEMLRRANHALADDVHLLQTALADLYAQIHEFAATYGEADFYTGAALAVLAKTAPLDYHWPFHSPTADEAIAKLLAKRGPNVGAKLPHAEQPAPERAEAGRVGST